MATIAVVDHVRAQGTASAGALHDLALPDRPDGSRPAIRDAAPARSHALLDFIRLAYDRPRTQDREGTAPGLPDTWNVPAAAAAGTLPLPLPPALWIDAVFDGRETPDTLPGALLRSRSPALFYHGLLSVDDDTRAWLSTQPGLIGELAARRAAAFVVAAPGLRVRGGALDVPGGPAALPVWEALVGRPAADPADFTRVLLATDKGRLALFFGTMAQLTGGQLRLALRLDSPDPGARVAAGRRLRTVFERLVRDWRVDDSVFSRPALDPALLASSLRHDSEGRPVVPGTRGFWATVFAEPYRPATGPAGDAGRSASASAEPADFVWLCEQVFTGELEADRRRYYQVLFASRLEPRRPDWSSPDTVLAVRAVHTFPALIQSLERAGLGDVAAFAAAARRAGRIAAIRDREAAVRALAQYQGALALVTRTASRGGMRPDALATAISTLSAVEVDDRGAYEGRLVRWLAGWLEAHVGQAHAPLMEAAAAGPLERDALAALAGPADGTARVVEWEGTRYRLDFSGAERRRLGRLLGEHSRPFLSSARALVEMADDIGRGPQPLAEHVRALEEIARGVGWQDAGDREGTAVARRYRDTRATLRQAVSAGRGSASVTRALLGLADDLLARGLMELAYAVALGDPDRPLISADEAARRHAFTREVPLRQSVAWELPARGVSPRAGWQVTGSVLGLDVELAEFALLRLSLKPPRKPAVWNHQRRVLTDAVALTAAAALDDDDHARLVSAIRNGRARLSAARTTEDAAAIADATRLSPARRTLLAWSIARADDVTGFLGPVELLWLGLERAPVPAGLHAWGAPAWPRTGCLCLEVPAPHAWEMLAGRRRPDALTSGFADLNLRLAELLHELGMPGALLAPVLAAATLDLLENGDVRGPDDRQALLDFVEALGPARVEQYLALLTTGGPLAPVEEGAAR